MAIPSLGGLSASSRRDLATVFTAGRRSTTVHAAADALGISNTAAARRLANWATQGWVRRVRRGLYLAVPVDAPDPRSWTEDPWYLADLVWEPCFITGWSAANHWSLTDQVFQSTIVATSARVRRVEQELAGQSFLVHHVPAAQLDWGLRSEWRHGRRIDVADPARTVAQLLDDPSIGGGIRHVSEILDTYVLNDEPMAAVIAGLERLGRGSGFKRLGYLLEAIGIDEPEAIEACRNHLTSGFPMLDPGLPSGGPRSKAWGLVINAAVDA